MVVDARVVKAVKAHAMAQYPRECCGLVIEGVYHPQINLHDDPSDVTADPYNNFRMPDDAWPIDGRVVDAVLHSHCAPHAELTPSASDMRGQLLTGVPWGIVLATREHCTDPMWFGDHVIDEPLWDGDGRHIPRDFIHGVNDCYTLIRKFYWQQRRIRLPEFPRDNHWWLDGGDLYRDGFKAAGFHAIPSDEVLPGDVVLFAIRSKVPNHGGVVLDHGLLLHHLQGRRSASEPIGRWLAMNPIWLRHSAAPSPSSSGA